jgi:SSS family solute:Na+ symporter
MTALSNLDYWIIGTFLAIILMVGLAASRLAARSMEHYFLGGRNLPWYLLGISGMSAWFDLTGTMIITSFLYLLGPRGLYIEFRGGAVLVLAFLLAYTAKWHRRSGCMTSAEWNTYRFGAGFSGEMVRLVSALIGIITTIGLLAYFVRGATLFMAAVFPVDPVWLTIGILGLASIYTVMAGFYGVVLSDVVQGAIMIIGCVVVSIIAWEHVPSAGALNAAAAQVTGNQSWIASAPAWHVTMPKGYEAYQALEMAAFFYLLRNILGGMATGGDTRYFASRNSREASLQCLLQGLTVMFRWPLMIGFAILGIYWVSTAIPGGDAVSRASEAIRAANPVLTDSNWQVYTDQIVYHPETAPAGLVDQLTTILGPDWKTSLPMVSSRGTVNPEVILPAVLLHQIPSGLRGLLIVALLSALMGALTGQVNTASSLFVRDIYQNFLRPKAVTRELISMAYLSSAGIVLSSFLMALAASSINDIWSWFIMSLTAGALGPGLLRLYWWRTNAWGMVAGLLAGGAAAVIQRAFDPGLAEWIQFVVMTSISITFTVVGSLATAETPRDIVDYFYHTTRPFGFWGPFWKRLSTEQKASWGREHGNDIRTVAIALVWQVCLFLIPMQILTHNKEGLMATVPIFLLGCVGLYFFWWRNLPAPDEQIADFASRPPVQSLEEQRELEAVEAPAE